MGILKKNKNLDKRNFLFLKEAANLGFDFSEFIEASFEDK
jgi:hypothetical protein